ncbi:Alpha/Beta hydrolase protein [Trichophaea hybrida]|nr:Alpha/Beta hydrolase protein [Trichophaea hybrida]
MASSFKSNQTPQVSVTEKLGLALVMANALRLAFQQYLAASISSPPPNRPPKAVLVQSAALRTVFGSTNWRQQHLRAPPSSVTYKTWVEEAPQKRLGYEHAVEDILGGGLETRIMWIGPPWETGNTSRKVLLYIHGGGFVMPLAPAQLQWMRFLREEVKRTHGQDVSVAVVEYSTAPGKVFPTPFHQATLAMNHLLAAGCPPSNISIVGDSAGGNATLSILSHILHPYPGITPVLPLSEPLASAVLISPWVTMATDSESIVKYQDIDYITAKLIKYWGGLAMGQGTTENEAACGRYHAEALLAPESWWKGLENAVRFVGITAGGCETLVDHILELDKKIRAEGGTKFELFVDDKEIHDGPILDFLAGRPASEVTLNVAKWLGAGFTG